MKDLQDFAADRLTYLLPEDPQNYYASDEYKMKVITQLSVDELVKIITTKPVIHLKLDTRNTGIITDSIEVNPVGNCIFTRDQ